MQSCRIMFAFVISSEADAHFRAAFHAGKVRHSAKSVRPPLICMQPKNLRQFISHICTRHNLIHKSMIQLEL